METPETISTSLQQGEWVTSVDFKDAYFHIPTQEQSRKYLEISCPGSDIPIQSTALWSVHSTHGVHSHSKGGETDGHTHGYKNPPVPRRLVGESQIPPGLSPAYTGSSENVSRFGLAGELWCRLQVRPQVWSGLNHTGPAAEPSTENTESAIPTGLSGPGIHVLDRFINSHRKASSPRSNAHETHTVASQKQWEGTRITRKGDLKSQFPAPPVTMVAKGRQCSHRSTITPNKTCSADLYRHIKRRVGHSLKRAHCTRNLVPSRKSAAYK